MLIYQGFKGATRSSGQDVAAVARKATFSSLRATLVAKKEANCC